MKAMRKSNSKLAEGFILLLAALFAFAPAILAKDTDIYAVSVKQNCNILLDSSGSMAWAVYENDIDYGSMYDYLWTKTNITDPISGSAYFNNHATSNKIYLLKSDIPFTLQGTIPFTGDPGDPNNVWQYSSKIDTYTVLNADGSLGPDGSANAQRLTTNTTTGQLLFDGQPLPTGSDINLNTTYISTTDATTGVTTITDTIAGFSDMLMAPGYYFSGYKGIDITPPYVSTSNTVATSGGTSPTNYFFAIGNWINMQQILNMRYTSGSLIPWEQETFPLTGQPWLTAVLSPTTKLDKYYPAPSVYPKTLAETTSKITYSYPAKKIRLTFSTFNLSRSSDYVIIRDGLGNQVAKYTSASNPTISNAGISDEINCTGTCTQTSFSIALVTSGTTTVTGHGYKISKVEYVNTVVSGGNSYQMQSRSDVAKDAMNYAVSQVTGKINWGFTTYNSTANGATIPFKYLKAYAANLNDTEATQLSKMQTAINSAGASGGTPLMDSLQDVWMEGFYNQRTYLTTTTPCSKNFAIVVTDGFPSGDTNTTKIKYGTSAAIDFSSSTYHDTTQWTSDPNQSPVSNNYYDDVASYMYNHSFVDGSSIATSDLSSSCRNVRTNHISFGANQPMLHDAAKKSGGKYFMAANRAQMISAFSDATSAMVEDVSFTAPVVSVDAVNKIQSGDDLYMGLFLPEQSTYWTGNLKKFKMGTSEVGSPRPDPNMVYDAGNQPALNVTTGLFLPSTIPFWGNNSGTPGASDIKDGGAGDVLLQRVTGYLSSGTYWNRPIYTAKKNTSGIWQLVKFDRSNITSTDLGLQSPNNTQLYVDKLINFVHGYTYDAATTTGVPSAVRPWILGAIVHSRPVVLDYFDTSDPDLPLLQRYIAVGSNDGMLHFFNDSDGQEVFAFVPPDILPNLLKIQAYPTASPPAPVDAVDGFITLYRDTTTKNPKYLIFGERMGGASYWNLNVTNWTDPTQWSVAWQFTDPEIQQSWSEVKLARIPYAITANGLKSYKDVAIFTGGYDQLENNFPETFIDTNSNGTRDSAETYTDSNTNNKYDTYNPGSDVAGRGIFVVDIDDPTAPTIVTLADGTTQVKILPFLFASQTTTSTLNGQKFSYMNYCFPASPSIVTSTDVYNYKTGTTTLTTVTTYQENVLQALYAIDIYANLYKTLFSFNVTDTSSNTTPAWKVASTGWTLYPVFSANPGSSASSGSMGGTTDPMVTTDQGRKTFFPPAISWGGSKGYFMAGNYQYSDPTIGTATFNNINTMASLFFGTGDREHPKYTMTRNRFYAIYDDTSVNATLKSPSGVVSNVAVTSATSTTPYKENNLLNLTCDELGQNTTINTGLNKSQLASLLTDNAVYTASSQTLLEYGSAHENDAKGWYIVLADQGTSACSGHVTYPTSISSSTLSSHDNHTGEAILSQALLYYGTLYFTSYQPSISDPCRPQGNGFSYALNYLNGSATYDLNLTTSSNIMDITDRYKKFTNISGIPSGFTIILRDGHAQAMASMGGALIGPGPDLTKPFEINTPGLGLELYYWRDSNSLQP